jgi:hypothetical protein
MLIVAIKSFMLCCYVIFLVYVTDGKRFNAASILKIKLKKTKFWLDFCSPDDTLLDGVHSASGRAVEVLGKVLVVGEAAQHAVATWGVRANLTKPEENFI